MHLRANLVSTISQKSQLGIGGAFNTSGNDGTITRFGWKAQNKSLLVFAGEAYNVEQGVSNELFPNERSAVSGCVYNGSPEDYTNLITDVAGVSLTGTASDMSSDVVNFANFMMLSAPPTPAAATDPPPTAPTCSTALVAPCATPPAHHRSIALHRHGQRDLYPLL